MSAIYGFIFLFLTYNRYWTLDNPFLDVRKCEAARCSVSVKYGWYDARCGSLVGRVREFLVCGRPAWLQWRHIRRSMLLLKAFASGDLRACEMGCDSDVCQFHLAHRFPIPVATLVFLPTHLLKSLFPFTPCSVANHTFLVNLHTFLLFFSISRALSCYEKHFSYASACAIG